MNKYIYQCPICPDTSDTLTVTLLQGLDPIKVTIACPICGASMISEYIEEV